MQSPQSQSTPRRLTLENMLPIDLKKSKEPSNLRHFPYNFVTNFRVTVKNEKEIGGAAAVLLPFRFEKIPLVAPSLASHLHVLLTTICIASVQQ